LRYLHNESKNSAPKRIVRPFVMRSTCNHAISARETARSSERCRANNITTQPPSQENQTPTFLLLPGWTDATGWIHEFMASNGTTIADEEGDFEDWIEQ